MREGFRGGQEDRGTPHSSVDPQQRQFNGEWRPPLHKVSRRRGEDLCGAGDEVVCITRLPRTKRARFDLEVEDAHHYVAEGFLVHNSHHDIRLADPRSGLTFNWASKKWPRPGQGTYAIPQPTHSYDYMSFEGTIPKGEYGAGKVRLGRHEPAELISSSPDRVEFNLYKGRTPEQFVLRRLDDSKWVINNVTPFRGGGPWSSLVPADKPKYREGSTDKINFANPKEVLQAKIDGAHCWPYDAPLETLEHGVVPIGEIVSRRLDVHVRAWSFSLGEAVWRRVTGFSKKPLNRGQKLVQVKVGHSRGDALNCTEEHRWKLRDGSCIKAKDIRKGTEVLKLRTAPSSVQDQIILGALLGDSSIQRPNEGGARISFNHGHKQKFYLDFKYDVLKGLVGAEPSSMGTEGSYRKTEGHRFHTQTLESLRKYYDLVIVDGVKRVTGRWLKELSPISLAVWFMDDGHSVVSSNSHSKMRVTKNNQLSTQLCTHGFTEEEHELLLGYFGGLGIKARVTRFRGHRWVSMGAASTLKLHEIIAPYMLPQFGYKMGFGYYKYPESLKKSFASSIGVYEGVDAVKELSTVSVLGAKLRPAYYSPATHNHRFVYDIEVEGVHNYFVRNFLVSNSIMAMRAGKPMKVFSYRVAKSTPTKLIEHTQKIPGWDKNVVPKELDGTVLRGETYAVDEKGRALKEKDIGALLNTSTLASREKQRKKGYLRTAAFDVVKYKGKDVTKLPYAERLKILKEVASKVPGIHLPPMAETPEEKQRLFREIEKGKEPLTREGVVAWDLLKPKVTKVKFRPDYDVYTRGVVPSTHEGWAGGVQYSLTPRGPVVGTMGSGFTHSQRERMLRNPEDYIGRVARAKAHEQFDSGALRVPVFKGWHTEKSQEKMFKESADIGVASIKDYPEVRQLSSGLGADLHKYVSPSADKKPWYRRAREDLALGGAVLRKKVLVAREDDKPVGYVKIHHRKGSKAGLVDGLYVDPEHRGMG